MFRSLLCLLGLLLASPILGLIALAFVLPITISGIGYLLACSLAAAGLIIAPWQRKHSFLLTCAGVLTIALVASVRLVLAKRDGISNLKVVTLPQGKETRWFNTILDEQDSLIFGETIFHYLGGDSRREHDQTAAALHTTYAEIRETRRVFPSPVISTYLNLQQPVSFDTVVIQPETILHPETAVIFLHGYMGNVTAQCWEIAQAAGKFGSVTACPSAGWRGQWWQPDGEAILAATFRYLREQGVEEFYLGGYSNGGYGIGRLVSKLRKEDGLRGLFFIDGISEGMSIREAGLPVLIIQAMQDERVSAEEVRQVAEAIGDLGTYVELEGDHFIIMKQPEPVQNAIVEWLESQESAK
jgi:pimeloyl-ACP methyl ester carboxylesterase